MYNQLSYPIPQVDCQITCMRCLKKEHSLFKGLSHSELEILERNRQMVTLRSGEYLYKEGNRPDSLFCLNKGKMKITKIGIDGNEQIVGLRKPVDFIGFTALISGEKFHTSAVALEESSVCLIEKADFFQVVKNNCHLAFKIMQWLAKESMKGNERLVNLTQKHMRGRLAEALLLMYDVYGVNKNNKLNVHLKRAEIAALANMTTSNAIRFLSSFKKEGFIRTFGREISILDFNALHNTSNIPW